MGTREALNSRERTGGRPPFKAARAASLALHLVLLLALLLVAPKPAPPVPQEKRISVEILDAGQIEAIFGPSADSLPPPRLPEGLGLPASPPDIISFPADLPPPPRSGETIMAERFLSAAVLADPRSAEALAALPRLASDERVVQLCTVEALAQIAALDAEYEPDLLSAYSLDDIRLTATAIDAPGAAFRSGGKWFGVAFRCRLTAALDAVEEFEFTIGAEIPHAQWAAHNLVEGNDPHGHH
jgi:hypothetical protein